MTARKSALELIQEKYGTPPVEPLEPPPPPTFASRCLAAIKRPINSVRWWLGKSSRAKQRQAREIARAAAEGISRNPQLYGEDILDLVRGSEPGGERLKALNRLRDEAAYAEEEILAAETRLADQRGRAAAWRKLRDQADDIAETWPNNEGGFLRDDDR